MKPAQDERKTRQRVPDGAFHHDLVDLRDADKHFPLRHFVYQVDVIDALYTVQIALVDGIHTQLSWLALRVGLSAYAYGGLHGLCPLHYQRLGLIGRFLAKIVDVRRGYPAKTLIPGVTGLQFVLKDMPGGGAGQPPVEVVRFSQ